MLPTSFPRKLEIFRLEYDYDSYQKYVFSSLESML